MKLSYKIYTFSDEVENIKINITKVLSSSISFFIIFNGVSFLSSVFFYCQFLYTHTRALSTTILSFKFYSLFLICYKISGLGFYPIG